MQKSVGADKHTLEPQLGANPAKAIDFTPSEKHIEDSAGPEKKFTDATFVCKPTPQASSALQETYVIASEQKVSCPKLESSSKALKTSKPGNYLNDISKLLEESINPIGEYIALIFEQ